MPSPGLNIKKSNIRIWIHQRNLGNLQKVVWEGHGAKLLVEHSTNAKVKRFLEAVPHIMSLIKDSHSDVINDDLNLLESHMNEIPPIVLSGKDNNGLTPLHKAAGLGYHDIARYIVEQYPKSLQITDNDGRTPLHYAAIVKDGGQMFEYLLSAGADESILDNKQKTAAFYRSRSNEIDAKLLQVLPECPRMSRDTFPANWDWNLIGATISTENTPKIEKKVSEMFENSPEVVSSPREEELKKQKSEEEAPEDEIKHDDKETEEQNEKEDKEDTTHNDVLSNDSGIEKETEENETRTNGNDREIDKEDDTEHHNEEDVSSNHDDLKNDANHELPEDTNPDAMSNDEHQETEPEHSGEEVKEEVEPEHEEQNIQKDEHNSEPHTPETSPKHNSTSEHNSKSNSATNSNNNSPSKSIKEDEKEHPDLVDGEGVIEGIVNGENEIESVNEEGTSASDMKSLDPEVATLIESGNMEQLAALVLNGHGEKLVGQKSDNPELQAFLENVPIYMAKINRIHLAARNGVLKELQAALDRRKFAVAKDEISPDGASPLHVATIFGNTSIVRYLAGRFPETVSVVDDNGRTPLHYAATVNDNGHYYNLLVHLGADIRTQDNFEHTPEYYRSNPEELSHRILLERFGAEESLLDEMLNDKVPNDIYSARKDLDDSDMIAVLDKCFNVLHGRRNSNANSSAASVRTNISTASTISQFQLSRHIRRNTFDICKLRITKLDHNLYDIIWPSVKKLPTNQTFRLALEEDFPAGIVAPDSCVYTVFREFLEPIIKDINCIDIYTELKDHPKSVFTINANEDIENIIDAETDLDPHAKNILSGTLDCTRNLEYFDFPKCLGLGQLEEVERILTTALLSTDMATALYPNATKEEILEKGSGTYYTMNEVLEDPSEAKLILASHGLLIPLWSIAESDRLHGKHWPYGRGVFISNAANFVAWINVLDHLRIVTCTPQQNPGNVGRVFSRMCRVMLILEKSLSFKKDEKFGYLSARPTSLGNTLEFNLTVSFPYLIKEPENLRHLCLVRGLYFKRSSHSNDIVRIGNQQCLGVNEIQTFEDFTTAVANILQLEKDLALSNSMHIAALFVNIFRRKKASLSE
ncbi:atp:guanido phosphotransferase n-terminal domain [Holotrichia oblita]|uniref:Atp:guanido phosphotransferase n-terminal domain n=1 Tax=Holotrichia oblita TaxID=644536 RepID=A0ACB9T2Y6_HOLOL|nr:atp:guanido phosphotransferase n-terminal domain [Holotrichia oblita]